MNWQPHLPNNIDEQLKDWLTNTNSMTARLQQLAKQQFKLTLINETWQTATANECQLLTIPDTEQVKHRLVYLYNGEHPLVFGKTLLPASTIEQTQLSLDKLGNQSIGSILFTNQAIRSPLEYCLLTPNDPLFQQAITQLNSIPKTLWARRSVFTVNNHKVLVYEVLLPALFE